MTARAAGPGGSCVPCAASAPDRPTRPAPGIASGRTVANKPPHGKVDHAANRRRSPGSNTGPCGRAAGRRPRPTDRSRRTGYGLPNNTGTMIGRNSSVRQRHVRGHDLGQPPHGRRSSRPGRRGPRPRRTAPPARCSGRSSSSAGRNGEVRQTGRRAASPARRRRPGRSPRSARPPSNSGRANSAQREPFAAGGLAGRSRIVGRSRVHRTCVTYRNCGRRSSGTSLIRRVLAPLERPDVQE